MATITAQPNPQSFALDGDNHRLSIAVEPEAGGDVSVRWVINGATVAEGAEATLLSTRALSATEVYAIVSEAPPQPEPQADSEGVIGQPPDDVAAGGVIETTSTPVKLYTPDTSTVQVEPESGRAKALVWSYDDDTFSWRDMDVEVDQALNPIGWSRYGFEPGHQERWEDYKEAGFLASTWAGVGAQSKRWSDTYSEGRSKYVLNFALGDLYRAEQALNEQGSTKQYYATRTQIDLDDLVSEWTTNNIKYIKQFVFHMQADPRDIPADRDNTVGFHVGWSQNLMEEPNWKPVRTINLEDRASGGQYKVDYRTSGRYLALKFDFTDSTQLALTGGDMDAEATHGR